MVTFAKVEIFSSIKYNLLNIKHIENQIFNFKRHIERIYIKDVEKIL